MNRKLKQNFSLYLFLIYFLCVSIFMAKISGEHLYKAIKAYKSICISSLSEILPPLYFFLCKITLFSSIPFFICFSVLYFLIAIAIIRKKSSVNFRLFEIMYFFLFGGIIEFLFSKGTMASFIQYSFYYDGIIIFIALFYFNRQKIRQIFSQTEKDIKREHRLHFLFIKIVIVIFLIYSSTIFYFYKTAPEMFSSPEEFVYSYNESKPSGYKEQSAFDCSLYVPEEFKIRYLDDFVVFDDKNGNLILISDVSEIEQMFFITKKIFGIKNLVQWNQRLAKEKIGIFPLSLKKLINYSNIVIVDKWYGILKIRETSGKNGKKIVYDFLLFDNNKSIVITFGFKKSVVVDEELIRNVISSLKSERKKIGKIETKKKEG
jgi:hypothetical protein